MIAGLFHLVWKFIWNTTVILVCASLIFIGFKSNQPMSVPDTPEGMTYIEFMNDRIDAAKTVEPSRCGWGNDAFIGNTGSNLQCGVYDCGD